MSDLESRIRRFQSCVNDLRDDLETLLQCLERDVPSALNKMRFIAEKICQELCKRNEVSWGNVEPTLERMIGPLVAKGVIPKDKGIHMKTVQAYASPGSHYQDTPLSSAHASVAALALLELLEWHFSLAALAHLTDEGLAGGATSTQPGPPAADASPSKRYLEILEHKLGAIGTIHQPRELEHHYVPARLAGTPEEVGEYSPDACLHCNGNLPPSEGMLLRKHRILVVGDSGSGKTTFLKHLAVTLARSDGPVPLFIDLTAWERAGSPLDLTEYVTKNSPGEATWLVSQATAGNIALILDGLERLGDRSRELLHERIQSFAGPIAASCRYLSEPADSFRFERLKLLPFRDHEIKNFMEKRMPQEALHSLLNEVRSKPGLLDLVRNPLILELLCDDFLGLSDQEGGLPERRTELLSAILHERVHQFLGDDSDPIPLIRDAAHLAYLLSGRGERTISVGDAARELALVENSASGCPPEQRIRLMLRASLVVGLPTRLQFENWVRVVLCAQWLGHHPELIESAFCTHAWDPDWESVWPLLVSQVDPSYSQRLLALLEREPDDIGGQRDTLIAHFASEMPLEPDTLRGLLDRFQADRNRMSIQLLAAGPNRERVVKHLVSDLKTGDEASRVFAADLLGGVGSVRAYVLDSLFQMMGAPEKSVRDSAAVAFGKLGSFHYFNRLVADLTEADGARRIAATIALEHTDVPEAVPLLVSTLEKHEDDSVWAAATALAGMRSAEARRAIHEALASPKPIVREAAQWALGAHGTEHLRSILSAALPGDTRLSEALASGGKSLLSEVLGDILLDKERSRSERGTAAWALGKLGSVDAVAPLVKGMKDENPLIRKAALWALPDLRRHTSAEDLFEALKDEDDGVRGTACWAIGASGDEDGVEHLLDLLQTDPVEHVRTAAAHAAGVLGKRPAILSSLLQVYGNPATPVALRASTRLAIRGIAEKLRLRVFVDGKMKNWAEGI